MGEIVVRELIRWQKHRTNRQTAKGGHPAIARADLPAAASVADAVAIAADAVAIAVDAAVTEVDAAVTAADAAVNAADAAVSAAARPKLTWKS